MPAEYTIEIRCRWWFMPLLKLLVRFGVTKKGKFDGGAKSAGIGFTGNPSVEVLFTS